MQRGRRIAEERCRESLRPRSYTMRKKAPVRKHVLRVITRIHRSAMVKYKCLRLWRSGNIVGFWRVEVKRRIVRTGAGPSSPLKGWQVLRFQVCIDRQCCDKRKDLTTYKYHSSQLQSLRCAKSSPLARKGCPPDLMSLEKVGCVDRLRVASRYGEPQFPM